MKTNISEQSAVWLAAFAEGLVRGEAAFGQGHSSALGFAESYAYLVEAEQQHPQAPSNAVSPDTSKTEAKATWARAFKRLS